MKAKDRAIMQMLLCAALWSIAGIFLKNIPHNSFVISGSRSFIAGIALLAYMLFRRMPVVINRRTLTTGLFISLTYTCFVAANKLTTAANAIVLQFTSPVFIMIFSAFLYRERFRERTSSRYCSPCWALACFSGPAGPRLCAGEHRGRDRRGFYGRHVHYHVKAESEERMSCILLGQGLAVLISLPFFRGFRRPIPASPAFSYHPGRIPAWHPVHTSGEARSIARPWPVRCWARWSPSSTRSGCSFLTARFPACTPCSAASWS
jgi:uncharacterized membrane protein